ncbi:MAG: FliM/FliN family flagellar motor switch protein [Firmicutes bacterium]|nr:flagellar motor switch protein FliM [Alicyclobacillaceae bacterium]MCL6497315.1 FliM/FliN family flagellar motor switch protein [Bacillota bacterium]
MGLVSRRAEIRPYDFQRPYQLSRPQLDSIALLRESYTRLASNFLSTFLRVPVQMRLGSLDQMGYEDWLDGIDGPTVLTVYRDHAPALNGGTAIVQCDPILALAMIDRALGGPGSQAIAARELTEIETAVFRRIVARLLDLHAQSWGSLIQLQPTVEGIEFNPAFAPIAGEGDLVVVEVHEVAMEGQNRIMRWIWPYAMVQPLVQAAARRGVGRDEEAAPVVKKPEAVREHLEASRLPVRVLLGRARLSLREFGMLKEEDVLVLENRYDRPLPLTIAGQEKFLVVAGRRGRHLAVRVVGHSEGGSGAWPKNRRD